MRCSIVYSDKVATLPVITANTVWKEIETTLKARLKHVDTKDNWWADKVRAGDTSQSHADEAMTKMRAEAAEAKVVLIEWNKPESISLEDLPGLVASVPTYYQGVAGSNPFARLTLLVKGGLFGFLKIT